MKNCKWHSITTAMLLSTVIVLGGCSSDDDDDTDPTDNGADNGSGNGSTATFAFGAAVDSPVLDFSSERVYWDLETNSVVTSEDDWELSVRVYNRNYQLQVNGGASGNGEAGVGLLLGDDPSAFDVTDPSNTAQVYKYFGDSVTGALSTPGGYGPFEYSVEGNHQMWPTYATYLVKDASENLYKFQILSNYGTDGTGASGNLVIRHASSGMDTTVTPMNATDASTAAGFDLMAGAVTSADDWHFAYQRYIGFKINGGESGEGGVSACLAASYPSLYNTDGEPVAEQFRQLTAESTLADFEGLALAEGSCLEETGLIEDSIDAVISSSDWLSADYSNGAPVFSASTEPTNGWIIRSATMNGDDYNYARVKVKELTVDLSGAPVRQLTLSVEPWEEN